MGNQAQPFYHLRTNKYVDRQIFAHILSALNKINSITGYTYVGLGSYLFEDFKLIHNRFDITKMISLEKDKECFKRAEFNKPLRCITVLQESTSEYIATMDTTEEHFVVWLDYTSPREIGKQFDDFCRLISILNEKDIVRITLNANPSSLGNPPNNDKSLQEHRLEVLKSRLGDFVPAVAEAMHLVATQYPLLLLSCLKKAAVDTLMNQEKILLPLSTSIYDDNTQMLTFTGVILNNKKDIGVYKKNENLKNYCAFKWDKPLQICIPPLTIKETIHINNTLPIKSDGKRIMQKYPFIFGKDENLLKSYIRFYKEYPHFHTVNF